ncbi:XAC2610-related protein [Paenibacillus monticola]|uniref:Uncharacterized protein n=1 Tax=Paenibacillus monticola TaxID=2666075 RepID=A0A7X2L0Z7_9BACL|nr:hypothetical protein [Paenibacillus monticola]MRN52658.1 hypothetical protein [Paenibacillus monticola]
MRTVKVFYVLLSVVIGVACFYGLLFIAFSVGDGLLTQKDPAGVCLVLLAMLFGVGGYLALGVKIDRRLVPLALALMIAAIFFTLPIIQTLDDLKDNHKKSYASKHQDDYIVQLNSILQKDDLPMELDSKSSNFDTLYKGNSIWLNFEKANEEPVTEADVNMLLTLLPEVDRDVRIRISFGVYNSDYAGRESSMGFMLDQDKVPENCTISDGYEYLCAKYAANFVPVPSKAVYSTSSRINDSLPEFTFTVYGVKKEPLSSANQIVITNKEASGEIIQELPFNETSTSDTETFGFIMEDMNFDGYLDIRIQADTPAAPNIPYDCWLWDANNSKFIRNSYLEEIQSPEFDTQKQIITSIGRSSASEHFWEEYKYIDGIPTLMKRTEEEINQPQKIIHTVVWELVNGELEITEDYKEAYVDPEGL